MWLRSRAVTEGPGAGGTVRATAPQTEGEEAPGPDPAPPAAAREAELRRLRKMNVAFEEQNAVLQRHTQNMSSARERLEQELALEEQRTLALQQQLQAVRQALTASFASLPVPGAESPSPRAESRPRQTRLLAPLTPPSIAWSPAPTAGAACLACRC